MLNLTYTQVSDAGCAALAAALDSGALPALEDLALDDISASAAARESPRGRHWQGREPKRLPGRSARRLPRLLRASWGVVAANGCEAGSEGAVAQVSGIQSTCILSF